ncbi:MAG: hypothetical protein AAF525_21830, partial [Pseudomonadota bacterium]
MSAEFSVSMLMEALASYLGQLTPGMTIGQGLLFEGIEYTKTENGEQETYQFRLADKQVVDVHLDIASSTVLLQHDDTASLADLQSIESDGYNLNFEPPNSPPFRTLLPVEDFGPFISYLFEVFPPASLSLPLSSS